MSEQNVKIVRAVYDSFAVGDVDAVFAAMTPDIEWDESEGMPYGGVYRGREAIVSNVFGPILDDVEGFTAAPDEILGLDDTRVVALGRHGGQGANGPGARPFRAHLDRHQRPGVALPATRRHPHLPIRHRHVVPLADRPESGHERRWIVAGDVRPLASR
jgi:ketosteroid isomerase-like protein